MKIILRENHQFVWIKKYLIKCRQNLMWAIPNRSMSLNLYSVGLLEVWRDHKSSLVAKWIYSQFWDASTGLHMFLRSIAENKVVAKFRPFASKRFKMKNRTCDSIVEYSWYLPNLVLQEMQLISRNCAKIFFNFSKNK